jgi:hypothetical protein
MLPMRIGVCGIACEKCPRRVGTSGHAQSRPTEVAGTRAPGLKGGARACPNGEAGCLPKDNPFCKIATCALGKGVKLCFECPEFPCETTRSGPISYGYCCYLAGKDGP